MCYYAQPLLKLKGFYKGFFLTLFYAIVDYHFSHRKLFPIICNTICSYSVGGDFTLAFVHKKMHMLFTILVKNKLIYTL